MSPPSAFWNNLHANMDDSIFQLCKFACKKPTINWEHLQFFYSLKFENDVICLNLNDLSYFKEKYNAQFPLFCTVYVDSFWLSGYNFRIYSLLTLTNHAKYFTLLQTLTHVWVDNSLIKFGCVIFGSKFSTDYPISC